MDENHDDNLDDNLNDNDGDLLSDFMKIKDDHRFEINDNTKTDQEVDELNKKHNISNKIDDNNDEEIVLGIDLGTSNSVVSIWINNNLVVIPDEYGNKTIPSCVAYTNVSRYIGFDAKNQKEINTNNVYYEVKRLIGKKMDDPDVLKERKLLSYGISCRDDNKNICLLSDLRGEKTFTPEEISANILTKLKQMAQNYLKKKVTKAVVTVPARFNDCQRQATKDAARIAGLDCLRIINEPTAASLAYGLMNRTMNDGVKEKKKLHVIVYDFGGGTLDVSLVEIEDMSFMVLADSGITNFGGSDFDKRLMQYAIAKFQHQNKIENMDQISKLSLQKLRSVCETAKKILSTNTSTYIAVKDFYDGKDLYMKITREEFEKLCGDLFLLCLNPIDEVLHTTEKTIEDIDEIIMVGGMTRMPSVYQRVKMRFRKEPNCSINPDEAVSAGAAIMGYIIMNKKDPFSDSVTLVDIIPLSMGVETVGGVFDTIIERNTIIPCSETRKYTTDDDYVDSITVKIYEGERTMTKDNIFVGEFELKGIQPVPRGVPEIDVTFTIDINGIVTVTAEDTDTHEKSGITVTSNKGRLSREEIERLIEESRDLEIRDELEKRKKLLHYEIDDLCSNILINIGNNEFKLSDHDKGIIKNDIEQTILWLKEKKYYEREEEELETIGDKIKKRYGVLILRGSTDDTKVSEFTSQVGTTVYGNDEDEETEKATTFEAIENEKLGLIGMTDPEKADIKEVRNTLTELCYSVFDIIGDESLKIDKHHKDELRDFIDDTLLWVHIHDKPTRIDYKMKIDEVNDACNKIMEHYNNDIFNTNELISAIKSKRDELENLCLTIQVMIEKKAFPLLQVYIDILKEKVDNNLHFIYDGIKQDNDEFEKDCEKRLNELNEMCTNYNNKMHGLNITESTITKTSIILDETDMKEDDTGGTSIATLRKRKQEDIIKQMIIEDDSNFPKN